MVTYPYDGDQDGDQGGSGHHFLGNVSSLYIFGDNRNHVFRMRKLFIFTLFELRALLGEMTPMLINTLVKKVYNATLVSFGN